MAEHLVVERGFWARLFLGRLRLEHHPEVLKVVVQRKGMPLGARLPGGTCYLVATI